MLMSVAVVYDGEIALHTPLNLWTSTGVGISPAYHIRSLAYILIDPIFRSRCRTHVPSSCVRNSNKADVLRSH